MKKGKFFIVGLIACSLIACSQNAKKQKNAQNNGSLNSLYALPSADKEKAAKINLELGVGYLKQDQMARAKSKFNRAKELAPNLPEVHYTYGYFLERVGENDDAEKAYQKAIALNTKNGNAHNMYGAFLCRRHKYKEAEKEFLRAVDDPSFNQTAETYENAGLCVLQIPEVAKATDYFEKALRYDANRSDSMLELAIIKLQMNKHSESKEYYSRYNRLAKPNARSLLLGLELAKHFGDKNLEQSNKILLNAQYPNAKLADLYTRKS